MIRNENFGYIICKIVKLELNQSKYEQHACMHGLFYEIVTTSM